MWFCVAKQETVQKELETIKSEANRLLQDMYALMNPTSDIATPFNKVSITNQDKIPVIPPQTDSDSSSESGSESESESDSDTDSEPETKLKPKKSVVTKAKIGKGVISHKADSDSDSD